MRLDAATRFRSDIPFGPNLNLIGARSILIIGVRDCSSHEVFSMLDLNATRVPLMSLMRAVTEVRAARTPIIVRGARTVDRSIERLLRLTQERFTLLWRFVLSFFHLPRSATD